MKVEVKQRWIDVNDKPARVMAVAEGWVMLRRPQCVPFVLSKKDLIGFWRPSR